MEKKGLISKVLFFNVLSLIMITAFTILGSSCGSSGGADGNSPTDPTNEIKYEPPDPEKHRDDSPDISEYKWEEQVKGNTEFTLEFYDKISDNNDNVFFSPHSISLTLAMAYAGARNETKSQMADALNFTNDLHAAFNYLDAELASRGNIQNNDDGDRFALTVDNSLWGQTGYEFNDQFLDVLAFNYGAGLKLLNFSEASEDSRVVINNWISKETYGKIENLLQKGAISSDTRFILTNTVYFKASWKLPFEEELTQNVLFTLLDGTKLTVPMMSKKHDYKYVKDNGYEAVELDYYGEELSMVIILPEIEYFKMFEELLNTSELDIILKSLQKEYIQLKMPKFTYEPSSASLKDRLKEMGMEAAFKPCGGGFTSSECSDFSGIDGTRGLFISDVIHKAFISVDEDGTEAAAATGFPGPGSTDITPIPVTIDHPFIFFIRDTKTEVILFMGRIMNPAPSDST